MVRLAVVGCGHWGKNLVRNFADLGALAGLVDENPDRAQSMAAAYDVPVLDFETACDHPELDALVISAPAVTHCDLSRRALLAGKHVFVEKPVAMTLDEAETLVEVVKSSGKILMVGHLLRYHPAFEKLSEICAAGKLGELRYVYSNRLNLGKLRTEENILWSFAPHDISMILALFGGEPVDVEAVAHSYVTPGIADVTTTHLRFKNDAAAHIHVSWLHPFKEQRLVVIGDKAMAVFDDGLDWSDKVKVYSHRIDVRDGVLGTNKADAETVPLERAEPLRFECQHFLDCVSGGIEPLTNLQEGMRVLRVLNLAQQQINYSNRETRS